MERLVQFLSGHERAVLRTGVSASTCARTRCCSSLFALLLVAFVYFVYVRPRARVCRRSRVALVALRSALFLLIVFLLLKPVVVVPSVVPRSSTVALLADDSRSMQMADAPRGARVSKR